MLKVGLARALGRMYGTFPLFFHFSFCGSPIEFDCSIYNMDLKSVNYVLKNNDDLGRDYTL